MDDMNKEPMPGSMSGDGMSGGRRHMGTKKMHKGKRHGNASLRAWVTFVKKVQREEHVSYKEAMSLAKKRKDRGEKWRGGGDDDVAVQVAESVLKDDDMAELDAAENAMALRNAQEYEDEEAARITATRAAESVLEELEGGRRRRRRGSKKRRGTKKRRGSRRRRH